MPELPEVETIKNELTPHIIGRRVTGITLNWEGIVLKPSAEEFCSRLIRQEITGLGRRGKYLIFHLGSGEMLIIHLRMTGSLLLKPTPAEPEKFVRAVIHLDGDLSIHFRDPRKFGVMWLTQDLDSLEEKLGPEPLEDGFAPELLAKLLANRKAPIKLTVCHDSLDVYIHALFDTYHDILYYVPFLYVSYVFASVTQARRAHCNGHITQVIEIMFEKTIFALETFVTRLPHVF